MSFNSALIKHLNAMLKLLQEEERKNDVPDYEPEPPKLESAPKGETQTEAMWRRARNDVASGKAICMRAMGQAVPKPKPPRAPGMQQQRWGGYWWHL